MEIYRWSEVEKTQLDPQTTRQAIHGETMTIARFEFGKGSVIPQHSHRNEQISTVVSGAVKFVIGGRELIVRGGESVRIPPHVSHGAEALEDSIAMEAFSPARDDWR